MGEVIQEPVSGKTEAESLSKNFSKQRKSKGIKVGKSQELRETGSSFWYITVRIRNIFHRSKAQEVFKHETLFCDTSCPSPGMSIELVSKGQ